MRRIALLPILALAASCTGTVTLDLAAQAGIALAAIVLILGGEE